MTILLIALAPAVAVLLIAILSQRKRATIIAALVAAAVGLFTGNLVYAALDIAAVAGATWLAWRNVDFRQVPPPVVKAPQSDVSPTNDKPYANGTGSGGTITWLVIAIAVGAYFWNRTESQAERKISVAQPAETTVTSPTQTIKTQPQNTQASTESARTESRRVSSKNAEHSPTKRSTSREGIDVGGIPTSGHTRKMTANCVYKGVMSDQDYRNCGVEPPRP